MKKGRETNLLEFVFCHDGVLRIGVIDWDVNFFEFVLGTRARVVN
jgi:hypothetical protein